MSVSVPGGGGGEVYDIFIHALAWAIFLGSKFRISIFIFFVFRRMKVFLGGIKNSFLGCLKFLIFFG